MIVLGIHEGHDAGAAVIEDGKIVSAVNEERLTREKLYLGVPKNAIKEVIRLAKIKHEDIDKIAVAGTLGIMASLGWERISLKKKLYQFLGNYTPFPASDAFIPIQRGLFRPLRNRLVEKYVRELEIKAPIEYVDHHRCHAASAYYTSGRPKCLVITSDGSGDAISSSVYIGEDGKLELLREFPTFHSIAYWYGYITQIAGFKMFRHEGKITGLSAHGNPNKVYKVFENAFDFRDGKPINKVQLIGHGAIAYLKQNLQGVSREDYSAAIQRRVEHVMQKFALHYINETGIKDLAVAGGIFANVRINQVIAESKEVNSYFIHPHMGDGGLAVGAALSVWAEDASRHGEKVRPYKLNDVYFGAEFTNEQIEQAIKEEKLKGEFIKNIEKYVAEEMNNKRAVGHFNGRMEYGPRALGNRSILYDPTDASINDWLNARLRRTEFMPFAPSLLDTAASRYYINYEKNIYPAQFMTITFHNTKEAQFARAVVHLDNTTRPQVVSKEQNPRYYKILKEYEKLTGMPIFVNTSFNIHEEPIVCSPKDAVRSLKKGTVDTLVMGNWVVK